MSVTINLRRAMASATAASALFTLNPAAHAQSEPTWWTTDAGQVKVSAQFLDQARKAVPSDNGDIPRGFLATFKDTVKAPSVETRLVQFPRPSDAPDDGKLYYSSKQLTFFAIVPPTGLTAVATTVCGELNNQVVYYGAVRSDGKVEQKSIESAENGCLAILKAARRASREAAAAAGIK